MRARLARAGALLMALGFVAGGADRAEAGLLGSSVTGAMIATGDPTDLTNHFDPTNGFVPNSYLNAAGTTVMIADPPVEFGFFNENVNLDTADFTDTTLTLTDISYSSAFSTTYSFMNDSFIGLALTQTSDTFGGISASLVGNLLTIVAPQINEPGTYTATFSFAPAVTPVPEPSTITLAATAGLMGLGSAWRRRKAQSVA